MNLDDLLDNALGVYIILGLLLGVIFLGSAISLDIKVENEYRGNYKLACDASTPELMSHYLELYLEDTKDFHGYTALIYKNPNTDIDEQRRIVQSFLARAKELSKGKSLENQSIERQIGMGSLKNDMIDSEGFYTYKDLHLIRWYMVNAYYGFLAYIGFFVMMIWWWTFGLWAWIREIF